MCKNCAVPCSDFLFCGFFVWFWYQGNGSPIERISKCHLRFTFWSSLGKIGYQLLFMCLLEFPCETIQSCTFVCWEFFDQQFTFFLVIQFFFFLIFSLQGQYVLHILEYRFEVLNYFSLKKIRFESLVQWQIHKGHLFVVIASLVFCFIEFYPR